MKQIIVIFLIIGLISCEDNKPIIESIEDEEITAQRIDSILKDFKFDYESPIIIDSSNQLMIPISTELLERRINYSKSEYYSNDFPRYWNILFYNRKTGNNRLLTEDKIRISSIYANKFQYEEEGKVIRKKILYQLGYVDFNKDGKLDENDPEYLFSSDINGENLMRVSPLNEDLQYFEVIPNSNQIMMRTLRDANQDLDFDREDESIWYKAELIHEKWQINEIIDSIGRKKIENLYFEHWLRKK